MAIIHGLVRSWLPQATAAAFLMLGGACRNKDARPTDPGALARTTTPTAAPATGHGNPPPIDAQAHASALPPIDCPLHKLGVDPMHLRPFDEVEKYIAFLEKPERALWQKPEEVVKALGLKGTETLVDVGAGSGYFTFRFARALPRGKVIAADTEAEMIRHIHHRVMSDGLKNVQAMLSKPGDPEVSKDADWVFICDVLHHVPDRAGWLRRVGSEMKPGARLALIEFKEGELPEGPPASAKIPRAQLMALAKQAGLVLDAEKPTLLPYQIFLVFRKP
jgi:ubiquinone/menaquinone biosynthesis C-methylase UbiE